MVAVVVLGASAVGTGTRVVVATSELGAAMVGATFTVVLGTAAAVLDGADAEVVAAGCGSLLSTLPSIEPWLSSSTLVKS